MKIDFRLFETIAEIRQYKDLLKSIEEQEIFLSESKRDEVEKYIESLGVKADEAEWDILWQQYEYETEYLYPKAFRGAFLISLWATFEAGIQEISNMLQNRKGRKLKLSDIKAKDILDKINKYFTHELEFDLKLSNETWAELENLYLLRNCFAHSNGRIEALKENKRRKINNLIKSSKHLSQKFGYIFIEMKYLHDIYGVVSKELERIIEQYKLWEDKQNNT